MNYKDTNFIIKMKTQLWDPSLRSGTKRRISSCRKVM